MPESYVPLASLSGVVTEEAPICLPPPHRHHHPGHELVEELFGELVRFGAHADAVIVTLIHRIKSEFN